MRIKRKKNIVTRVGIIGVLIAFAQCASSQKIDKTAPIVVTSPYYQQWIAGVQGGGSGFTIYIPVVEHTAITLHEAYFRGKKITLNYQQSEQLYKGRYTDPKSLRGNDHDIVMDADPKKEFKNEIKEAVEEKIPFELAKGECIVGYIQNGQKAYFRITDVVEKPLEAYPMQRPQNK